MIHYRKLGVRRRTSRSTATPSRRPTSISPEEIKRVYGVEVQRDAPGARHVIVFEHNAINRVFC